MTLKIICFPHLGYFCKGAFILFFTDSITEKHSDDLIPFFDWCMGFRTTLNVLSSCTYADRDGR
jgi:hypothetical protein